MASWTYIDGNWQAGNPPLIGPMSHAMWQGSVVFDGARAFGGMAPDLDLHCERVVQSAKLLGLGPMLSPGEIEDIAREGIGRFAAGAELYIRPMFWAEAGSVVADPGSTRFALAVHDAPLPPPSGFSANLSRYRCPGPESAPTGAKAACLYPNYGRAEAEARRLGFDNAVMLDPLGHVSEFTTANLFMVKDGVVQTPVPNGCFLNGITRQRVIRLLRHAGAELVECSLDVADLRAADEIFATSSFAKLQPLSRLEERWLEPGPVFRRARELYWEFAEAGRV
jgi:branched-chain amino acid aminotransferase